MIEIIYLIGDNIVYYYLQVTSSATLCRQPLEANIISFIILFTNTYSVWVSSVALNAPLESLSVHPSTIWQSSGSQLHSYRQAGPYLLVGQDDGYL